MRKNKSKRFLSLGLSLLVHGAIVYLIATATLNYITPKGSVTTIDFSDAPISKGITAKKITSKPVTAPVKPVIAPKPPPPIAKTVAPKPKPKPKKVGTVPVKEKIANVLPEKPKTIKEEPEIEEDIKAIDEPDVVAPVAMPEIEDELDQEIEPSNLDSDEREFAKEDMNQEPEEGSPEPLGLPEESAPTSNMPPPAGYADGVPVYTDGQIAPSRKLNYQYPTASRFLKEEGAVQIQAMVNEKGIVETIGLNKSSGYARLDQAALKAAKELKFPPTGKRFIYLFGPNFALSGNAQYLENRALEKVNSTNR